MGGLRGAGRSLLGRWNSGARLGVFLPSTIEATMAHVVHQHHHDYLDDSWPHVFYKATIIFLVLVVATAFYIAVSTTAATESVVVPTLPPMFPMIPLK